LGAGTVLKVDYYLSNILTMKNLVKAITLCLLASISFCTARSQASRLFNDIPDSLLLSEQQIGSLFNLTAGSPVDLAVTDNFHLKGTIKSSIQKYENLKSLIIESSNYKGAMISLARRTEDDNSIVYVGRILSSKHDDGFELRKNESGQYYFRKIEVNNSIVE
jgi:hypothetical protein